MKLASLIILVLGACSMPEAHLLGDGGKDAGICADDGRDGGVCMADSECPPGYFCDVWVSACPADPAVGYGMQMAFVQAGTCLRDRTACPKGCHVAGDCAPDEDCVTWITDSFGDSWDAYCTATSPCDAGECQLSCTASPVCCIAGCTVVTPPHGCAGGCVCPGNTCTPPGDCVGSQDGTLCDGGVCIAGICEGAC